MSEHIVSKSLYYQIFGALMVLTALTVLAALVDLENILGVESLPINGIIAMIIAVTKATLVVLFFMHVYYSSRLTKIIVVSGFFFLAIMIVFIGADYMTRSSGVEVKPSAGVGGVRETQP